MARAVGLDLGSHAVRAADVRLGASPVVQAFGQVGLPRGAIEHGEVIDPGTVAVALRRLWREAGIGERRVRVGLASLRTIVRQVEMPAMDDEELRSALEFQAGEFIPLPPEETLLDFQVLERFTNEQNEDLTRVLIAAIHRDTLDTALIAVREAGLQPVAVDLAPFALVRALAPTGGPAPLPEEAAADESEPEGAGEGGPAAEAIVSIGSGVTIVVIHEAGVVRFVRIVDAGGDDVTTAIEGSLGIPFEEAEALKRQLGTGVERGDEALASIRAPVASVINEIRGSIEFYTGQPEARPVGRTLVTGGGVLLEGLLQEMADALAAPVEIADPGAYVTVGDIGFLPEDLPRLSPYLPVPVGLALGGDKAATLQINLLPEGQRRAFSTSRVVLAGAGALAVVLAGLGTVTMQRNAALQEQRDRLAEQQAENQQIQAQIDELQGARDLQAEADQAVALQAVVLNGEVSWSRLLQEIGRIIPNDAWLQNLSGTAATGAEGAAGAGSLTFSGSGSDFPSAAAWLQRLATLRSIAQPWLGSVAAGAITVGGFEFEGVTFSSTSELTDVALSERARRAAELAGLAPGAATAPPVDTTTPPAATEEAS